MKTCFGCQTVNADGNRFCQQCGKPLDVPAPPPSGDATVRWTGPPLPAKASPRRTIAVATLFGAKQRLVIGRAPDCDVCLPHPSVSRYHALLEKLPEGLRLRDLASVNGVTVAGQRITEPVLVHEGERVGIGPFLFSLTDGVIHTVDSSRSLRLEARNLEKVVPLPDGKPRKLLDNINLVVNPGEFVSFLGPSGSGKSTLMDCLNGRRRATGGQVLANGEDFYRHFDSFRQSLGYVPQRDIVHGGLTVYRALYYTARLRLPTDTDPAELMARVEEVLREMELGPHRDTLVANLSGGQIKRVSLGAELLAQPSLLYIDEATSGLDAGTETRMMRLFRRLADEGRSLVCITHNVDNVDQCHLALVLARGKLVYYGPPKEAPTYFKVGRISEIYDRLAERELIDWEKQYAASSLCKEFVLDRLASTPETVEPEPEEPANPPPAPARPTNQESESRRLVAVSAWPPLADRFRELTARYLRIRGLIGPLLDGWHQFRVLTARYVELIAGDPRSLRLLLLQAPIVALFLLAGFVNKDYQQVLPIPRPLEENERRLLAAIEGLAGLINGDQNLNAEQQQALKQVTFKVSPLGVPMDLDATQMVLLLRQIHVKSVPPDQRKFLESTRFTVSSGDQTITVSGADLSQALTNLHQSHIPAKLLAIEGPVVPDRQGLNPRFTYMLLFILVMIVLWCGCNNAAKEIVKEEAIYGRERAVNLGIVPYLASKFLVQSLITIFQALTLMVLIFGTLELLHALVPGHSVPSPVHCLAYGPLFGVLALLSMTGVALGLLLSACVSTPDRANALLPYVLIPQMILGGGIISVHEGVLHLLAMTLSPVYWAYRAVHLGASELPKGFPGHVNYPDALTLPCEALVVQTVALLLLTAWFLKRKEAQ
jgi:ABC-type multidrug transport system ATPase subunit